MQTRLLAAVVIPLCAGCVTTGRYNAKVSELESMTNAHDEQAARTAQDLKGQIAALQNRTADLEEQLGHETSANAELSKKLDDTIALSMELKHRLESLGQNVGKLSSENWDLAHGLEDAQARLAKLRAEEMDAESRAATMQTIATRLRSMIDSGQVKVLIRDGRMLIAMPSEVLFDTGRIDLKPDGKTALAEVAHALAAVQDRDFLVAGHTDDVPIHTDRFPSNWELSTARAVEVTRLLIAQGMDPRHLAAGGYGEYDPVEPNDTPEHRALNRRIEIVLQPNLADYPSIKVAG